MILLFSEELGVNFTLPSKDETIYFGDDPVAVRCLFHSLLCLTSKEAAIVSGLYYVDKTVKPTEQYTYYVTVAGAGMKQIVAQARVSPSDPYTLIPPFGFNDLTNKRRAILTWKKLDTLGVFIPSYELYRSEQKTTGYVKLSKSPIYALYTGPSILDSTIVSFNDSTLQKDKIYYYKARALDVFGDYSAFSEPYQVTEKTLLAYAPYVDEIYKFGAPVQAMIKWKVEQVEENNIAYFKIFKSTKPDTLFVPVTEKLKITDRQYIDKTPTKNNYYKIMMAGKAGDTLWSSPSYLLVPDSIPPAAPVITSAICDSTGVVTIIWSHSKEIDLYGFHVYKANYQNEEFSRITTILKVDTTYSDTISLRVMDDAVYYQLVALDDSYNPSKFSNTMKAKRFDTIIPNSAVFRTFKAGNEGIALTWGNSSSPDVVKTTLFRKYRDETDWHVYKVFARDTVTYTTYTDTPLVKGMWYQYRLETADDDDLLSEFSNALTIRAYDNGIRAGITDVQVKANTRKRIVKISWKYPHAGVKNFQIYRSENDKAPLILKSLAPGTFEYYDTDTAPGASYTYLIKAEFLDGGESPFTEKISVKMK